MLAGIDMMDNLQTTRNTASVAITGLMVVNTRVSGAKESSMELGHTKVTEKVFRQSKESGRTESVFTG